MEYNYYFTYQKEIEQDECVYKGTCVQNPSLVFLHEIIILHLQELAFYLLNLKELGITNEKIKEDFIEAISGMIINIEYTPEQFYKIITRLYFGLTQAKELYISVCKRNNIEIKLFKSTLKKLKKTDFTDFISYGQKLFNLKYKQFTPEQMRTYELFLNIAKSMCLHLIELKCLGVDDGKAYEALFSMLGIGNQADTFLEKMESIIKEFVELDHSLLLKLYKIKEEKYGVIRPVDVSKTIKPGKAILVSGSNLGELELLLEASKDKGIDVYTHGRLIYAHAFPKFKTYPHLVGHFGGQTENYLLDFSEFPGAIFLTRHSFQRVESLFISRIFTTDVIAPRGIMPIMNNNFEPLIDSALNAEGFTEKTENPPVKLNLSEEDILNRINEVAQEIEDGKIKHFFAIGVPNKTQEQKEYFESFLKLLGDNCFVLSFSYSTPAENVLYVESDYGFPLLYKSLEILTRKISLEELNPIILYTRYEMHTISNMLYMKSIGIKKVYFAHCPPNLVNPVLIDFIKKFFDIKSYTTPEADLKDMLSN